MTFMCAHTAFSLGCFNMPCLMCVTANRASPNQNYTQSICRICDQERELTRLQQWTEYNGIELRGFKTFLKEVSTKIKVW